MGPPSGWPTIRLRYWAQEHAEELKLWAKQKSPHYANLRRRTQVELVAIRAELKTRGE